MPEQPLTPDECANCGAAVPRSAHACPECGADERTGCREPSPEDGLDLPEGYDEDALREHEAEPPPPLTVNGIPWHWWLVGVVLLVLLVLGMVRFF